MSRQGTERYGAQSGLRPFGPSGVIEVTQPQLLFQITNTAASAIDTSRDGYLFLRVRATSSLGATAEADYGAVQILTRYTGTNRYGDRDATQGEDDWVLPSVNSLLGTFAGVLWGDMSNMNGGPFPPYVSHQDGFDVDFKFAGYQAGQSMTDNKSAKLLAEMINSLPLDTVNQIDVMFATVDAKFIKQVEKRLSTDRKFFADRIHYESGHTTHFHIRFL